MNARRAVAVSMVAIVVLIAGCSSSAPSASGLASSSASPSGRPSPSGQLTRTSDGGQVTVVVDWAGPLAGAVFHVTLDTHAVDLDPLDLTDAVLQNDRGQTLAARPWSAPKGGHHRQGTLAFQGDAGPFLADTQWIELVIQDVGDLPERVLRWELGS